MEEEISLKELIITLWQGKVVIIVVTIAAMLISALYSLFLVTPLYRATATLDPAPLNLKTTDILNHNSTNGLVAQALEGIANNPGHAASAVAVTESGTLVQVTAEKPDPELAAAAANAVAMAVYDAVADRLESDLVQEVERLERSIAFYEERIGELFGKIDHANLPPDTQLDPAYISLRQQQGMLMTKLFDATLAHAEVDFNRQEHASVVVNSATPPAEPFNMRWKLNTAVAGVLGLMLSVFIVFARPYFTELISDQRLTSKQD